MIEELEIACLGSINAVNYSTQQTKEIVLRNHHLKTDLPGIDNLRIVSTAVAYRDHLFRSKGKHPFPAGDAGFYIATGEGKILGLSSFRLDLNLDPERFTVIQMQGTKVEYLSHHERKVLANIPWSESLLDVIETQAKECGIPQVWVTSAKRLPKVKAGILELKKMLLRYDVPAVERNYGEAVKDEWYSKRVL